MYIFHWRPAKRQVPYFAAVQQIKLVCSVQHVQHDFLYIVSQSISPNFDLLSVSCFQNCVHYQILRIFKAGKIKLFSSSQLHMH